MNCYKHLLLMFLTIFCCLSFCHILLSIFFSYALLLKKLFFLSISFSLEFNSFQVFIILFKSCEINLPSIYLQINYIPSDQLHAFLISDSPVNSAFSFLAIPCLYYVIFLSSSRLPNTRPVIRE